LAYFL